MFRVVVGHGEGGVLNYNEARRVHVDWRLIDSFDTSALYFSEGSRLVVLRFYNVSDWLTTSAAFATEVLLDAVSDISALEASMLSLTLPAHHGCVYMP